MTINKPIVFVGLLAILTAAAVARLHAAEAAIAPSWDAEERMMASQEIRADAIVLEDARQLQKVAESQALVAAWLRMALVLISLATGIAGMAVLGWTILANRQQQRGKVQWTQQLALLAQREEESTVSRKGDKQDGAPPTIRFDPSRHPKAMRPARRLSVLMPIEPVGALRRAA